jgi:glycosyltransferase involved in cell wall biosynthesis
MNSQHERISFILGSQFPTSRAYGVTTRETLKALRKESIEVKIFCLESFYSDKDFEEVANYIVNMKITSFSKLLRMLSNYGNCKLNYIIWRLALFLDLSVNLRTVRKYAPSIIWTRDPFIAYFYLKLFSNIRVVLEVHESVGKIFYKRLGKFSNIKFFPINKENNVFLQNLYGDNFKGEIMPMGVRSQSIPCSKEISDYVEVLGSLNRKVLKIGYIGAFEPNGYSKGVEDLINLAAYLQRTSLSYEVHLLGASVNELAKYDSIKRNLGLTDRYLSILPHVSHSEALSSMKKYDVLILPAYKSILYMGMPIKMLEYLISGRVTLIEDCELYRNFLPFDLYPLLYPSSEPEALFSFMNSLIRFENLRDYLNLSINFASKFTWEKRTMSILESMGEM